MAMLCPQCRGTFENQVSCPKCSVRLVFQLQRQPGEIPEHEQKWYQTTSGRLMAGMLLAIGMSFALWQLAGVILHALHLDTGEKALSGPIRMGLFQLLPAIALVVAGMLAGAGRQSGGASGALVGLISGLIATVAFSLFHLDFLLDPFASSYLSTTTPEDVITVPGLNVGAHALALYGIPLLQMIFGAIGGLIGSGIWPPPPHVSLPTIEIKPPEVGLETKLAIQKPKSAGLPMWDGPIAWVQVIIGSGVAVFGGSFGSKTVQEFFQKFFEIRVQTAIEDQVTLAEIYALSIILGGCIGGATKPNGLKQGVAVGVIGGIVMVPFLLSGGGDINFVAVIIASAVFLAPLGGWFGSSLLPPPPPPRLGR